MDDDHPRHRDAHRRGDYVVAIILIAVALSGLLTILYAITRP